MLELASQKCQACEGGIDPLTAEEIQPLMQQVHADWKLSADNKQITRHFQFKGFYKTMAFVNAMAWIANQELHHPDFEVTYNTCTVTFTTHAVEGLTQNDFICASKVDQLLPN